MAVASTADQQVTLEVVSQMQTQHQTALQKVLNEHIHEVAELLRTLAASQQQAVGGRGTMPLKALLASGRSSEDLAAVVCQPQAKFDVEAVVKKSKFGAIEPERPMDDHSAPRIELSKEKKKMQEIKKSLQKRESTATLVQVGGILQRQDNTCARRQARRLLGSKPFEYLMSALIVANCVVIGMQADYSAQHLEVDTTPAFFRACELIFLFAFTFELALRLLVRGCYFFSYDNPDVHWNVLDTFLVVAAIVDEIANVAIAGSEVDISAARLLRLLRLVRVNRMIKVLRFFKDLRVMILGIMSAMTSLLWAGILLFMIIFVFALCFMQFVTDHLASNPQERGGYLQKNFQSLARLCYILFMCISGGVSWIEVSEPLIAIHPMLGMLFCIYIAFAVFCVLNIITGVFVETATRHAYSDDEQVMLEEMEQRHHWVDEVKLAFTKADADNSEKVELEEFVEIASDPRVLFLMNKLGVDLASTKPEAIFALFDQDSDGAINVDEFATAIQHVRGPARSMEVARLQCQMKGLHRYIEALGEQICCAIEALSKTPGQDQSAASPQHSEPEVLRPEQPGCVVHPELESHRRGEVAEDLE